ncbi:MAG: hypothetical protein JO035_05000 [Betaproteobacteria bacterium]|nr:hypothetical protein [Betaproteobacteria bacterium]
MAQRKALSRRDARGGTPGGGIQRSRPAWPAALYGISPQYPGKLVQRLPDGTERVGTFRNGSFVPES